MNFGKTIDPSPERTRWFLSAVFFASLVFYAFLFFLADFKPTSTDTVNIGISIQKFRDTDTLQPFWISGTGFQPDLAQGPVYPWIQRLVRVLTPEHWTGIFSYLFVIWLVASALPVLVVLAIKQWTQERLPLYFGVLLTWGSFSVIRSFFVTPQNLFGYLGILGGMFFLSRFLRKRSISAFIMTMVMMFITAMFHQLSGMIFILILTPLLFREVYRRFGLWGTLGLFAGGSTIFAWFVGEFGNPAVIILQQLISNTFFDPGFRLNYPLWELPIPLGTTLVLLATVGLAPQRGSHYSKDFYTFIGTLLLPVIALSQLYLIGFYSVIPDRFVAYAWIPLVFAAAFGGKEVWEQFAHFLNSRAMRYSAAIVVTVAILAPAILHARSDIRGYGASVSLTPDYVQSFEWLNDYGLPSANVLTATSADQEEILYMPLYFDGKISRFTSTNYGTSPQGLWQKKQWQLGLLGNILYPLFPDRYSKLLSEREKGIWQQNELFIMIAEPDTKEAQALFRRYHIQYIWLDRSSTARSFFERSETFQPFFENASVVIYEKK